MATKAAKDKEPKTESPADAPEVEEPLAASDLDERTHAEMLMLYHEAVKTSRFGKDQQWRSVALGIISIFALGVLGSHVSKDDLLFRLSEFLAIVVGLCSIYLIVFYQFWQNTERDKLRRIMARLSNLARSVRGMSSGREASVRRFVVLGFMILCIIAADALMIVYLSQLPSGG